VNKTARIRAREPGRTSRDQLPIAKPTRSLLNGGDGGVRFGVEGKFMTREDFAGGAVRFEVGRVISTSLAVFGRNLGPFLILSLLIGIPYIVVSFWFAGSVGDIEAIKATGQLPSGFWGMLVVGMLIFMLTNALTQSAIVYGTFQDLRGQKASFGECLSRGLATLPRVIGAAFAAGIAITIGIMLLVVPGLILALMWWVLIPALVVEGIGIGAGFSRSGQLTSGHRWGILGLLVLIAVAQWIVSFVLGLVGVALGPTLAEIINIAVTLFFSALSSTLTAVGYYYLRAEKEGIVIDDIAKVFD
jgi:hypothetical protein